MRLVSLMSGGIDSPVAAYMMSEAGAEIVLLHMDNRPHSDDRSIEKVEMLAERLRVVTGKTFPLFIAPHGQSQTAIRKVCGNYQCVMCKRTMMFVAAKFAEQHGCKGIVMGDSLGQVASQTLRNIRSETFGLKMPVARPLIGMDKIEIEAVAKQIGTYEISIKPEPKCAVVPMRPITEADPDKVEELHDRTDLGSIIEDSFSGIKMISGKL